MLSSFLPSQFPPNLPSPIVVGSQHLPLENFSRFYEGRDASSYVLSRWNISSSGPQLISPSTVPGRLFRKFTISPLHPPPQLPTLSAAYRRPSPSYRHPGTALLRCDSGHKPRPPPPPPPPPLYLNHRMRSAGGSRIDDVAVRWRPSLARRALPIAVA